MTIISVNILIMRFYLVLIFTCVAGNTSFAQDCNSILFGEVIDFHDNTVLENATITITGKNRSTTSDEYGKFNFKTLCNGVIELEVSHPNCRTQFISIAINGNTYQKIRIEHHLEELNEVKVIGNEQKNTNSSQEEKLSKEDFEKSSGKSLGDALKNMTGVSSLNTGANVVKPVIQGLSGSRVLVINNNTRMQDMEWGQEHAPNIDINANQHISLIKGAAALEYGGDAIGGVIVLKPLPIARADSLYGKTQLNLFSNGRGGNISTSLTKSFESGFYLKAQGSLKRLGDIEAPEYILSNTGIKENGISLSVGKRDFVQGWEGYYSFFKTYIGILASSHIGNTDDLITAIESPTPLIINDFSYTIDKPSQEVTHHLAKLNYYRRFTGFGKLNVQYDFQNNRRFEFDRRIGDNADNASLDLKLSTHTVSSTIQLDSKKEFELKLGALGRFQKNFANPETKVRRLIPDYNKYDFGAFVLGEFLMQPNLTIDAGIRYDFTRMNAKKFYRKSSWEERGYDEDFSQLIINDAGTQYLVNPIFDYHNVSAMTGLQYNLKENQTLKLNLSLAKRAPNPSELFSDGLHHSAARIELGDLRIKNESSRKISLSYELNSQKWGFVLAPYLNNIKNFILAEPNDLQFTIRGSFPVWSYRQTNALLLGTDFSLYNNWSSKIRTNHKFSYVKGTDESTNIPLINIPAANLNNSISYSNIKWNNFIVTLESQYVFEQKRFPPNITVFSPQEQREKELNINTPPPAYHLLSFDASSKFSIQKKNDLSIGLNITNITNTNYRDYLNRLRYFVNNQGRNISLRLIYNY